MKLWTWQFVEVKVKICTLFFFYIPSYPQVFWLYLQFIWLVNIYLNETQKNDPQNVSLINPYSFQRNKNINDENVRCTLWHSFYTLLKYYYTVSGVEEQKKTPRDFGMRRERDIRKKNYD